MRNLFEHRQHLLRAAGLLVGGVLVFLAVRGLLVPEAYGEYGHYRLGALEDNRSHDLRFAGRQACFECHGDIVAARSGSRHERVGCESCHGALAAHAADPGSAQHDAEGWFATGDVAVIHPDGYLQITHRAKDVIKSGGEWISSVDLENCACGHPDVLMAAAIGVKHPKWEERPILLIVPRQGCTPARDSVLAHIAEHFAKWQLPDDVVIVEALPMTATGKISKKDLRQKFRDHLMQAS